MLKQAKTETHKQSNERSKEEWRADRSPGSSNLTGLVSQRLRWSLKLNSPKYPNYTCTSCPFVTGIPASSLSAPGILANTKWMIVQRQGWDDPAQTSVSVFTRGVRIGCTFNAPNWTLCWYGLLEDENFSVVLSSSLVLGIRQLWTHIEWDSKEMRNNKNTSTYFVSILQTTQQHKILMRNSSQTSLQLQRFKSGTWKTDVFQLKGLNGPRVIGRKRDEWGKIKCMRFWWTDD